MTESDPRRAEGRRRRRGFLLLGRLTVSSSANPQNSKWYPAIGKPRFPKEIGAVCLASSVKGPGAGGLGGDFLLDLDRLAGIRPVEYHAALTVVVVDDNGIALCEFTLQQLDG